MPERTHLSIGEVLSLLHEEFPDVTISKIRFLESQGLVDPERTPSGYRKFYDHDVDRLRWILRQQRENFLPLKVIRGRLTGQDEAEDSADGESAGPNGTATARVDDRASDGDQGQPVQPSLLGAGGVGAEAGGGEPLEAATTGARSLSSNRPGGDRADRGPGDQADSDRLTASHPAASSRRAATETGTDEAASSTGPGSAADRRRPPAADAPAPSSSARRGGAAAGGVRTAAGPTDTEAEAESFSVEELAAATGAPVSLVRDLQQYGLIAEHAMVAGTPYFDADALEVVRTATGFARHGVEARHLRAWRHSADREVGLFEQVIMPLLRQRNPEARRQAGATLDELATLGGDLRQALIDQALRRIH
jgi:DNA-binding transcriptional MerR regulator